MIDRTCLSCRFFFQTTRICPLTAAKREAYDTCPSWEKNSLADRLKIQNAITWIQLREIDMAKYCKLVEGFVANDYDCEKCNQCSAGAA